MGMTREEKLVKAWDNAIEMYSKKETRLWVGKSRKDENGNTYIPVQSQSEDQPHHVRQTVLGPMCDCKHIEYRGNDTPCVHILHVALKAMHAKKKGTRAMYREFSAKYQVLTLQ